jgi:hypothetical protein
MRVCVPAGGWPETDIHETLETMRVVYQQLRGDGYFIQVPGMFHLDMTEAPLYSSMVPWPGPAGPIGADRVHRIINAYSVAFFEHELRGRVTCRAHHLHVGASVARRDHRVGIHEKSRDFVDVAVGDADDEDPRSQVVLEHPVGEYVGDMRAARCP